MDPDVIFLILLYIVMLILTIGGITGLSKKIWKSAVPLGFKLIIVGLMLGLLIFALAMFNTTETGETSDTTSFHISRWELMIYSASLLIGLNWAINLMRKPIIQKIKLPSKIKAMVLTILLTILIPILFYFLADFLVNLNLFGSGG